MVKDVNPKVRERVFTRESAWLWALEKLRRNPPFDYAAITRNISDRTLRNIFWDVMVSIFYGEKSVPHRNYENVIDIPCADKILESRLKCLYQFLIPS